MSVHHLHKMGCILCSYFFQRSFFWFFLLFRDAVELFSLFPQAFGGFVSRMAAFISPSIFFTPVRPPCHRMSSMINFTIHFLILTFSCASYSRILDLFHSLLNNSFLSKPLYFCIIYLFHQSCLSLSFQLLLQHFHLLLLILVL